MSFVVSNLNYKVLELSHTHTLACCVRVVSMIINATKDIVTILDGANFAIVLK
jgi:hypothetical protein